MHQGKAIIFSAPSGSGKTTIVRHLLQQNPDLDFSVSACTRERRHNEIDGRDYYFFTPEVFKKKIAEGAFIEWEEVYHNRFYGTLKSEIERIWANNKNVIFDVDVVGGLNLKKYFQERALAVFVKAPSIDVIRQRLVARQTDSPESISQRVQKAAKELSYEHYFDEVIVNDNLEDSFQKAQQLYNRLTQPSARI